MFWAPHGTLLLAKCHFTGPKNLSISSSVADPNPDSPDSHVLGLLDPNPLVKGMEWIRILPSSCKNSKKNLDSYYFVTLFDFLSLKNDVNVTSKVIGRNFF